MNVTDRAELWSTSRSSGQDLISRIVWNERRTFVVDAVEIPVARLLHIVQSKHSVGRDKDRLFLATHREALEDLLRREEHKSG